jgi:hypothetical protein
MGFYYTQITIYNWLQLTAQVSEHTKTSEFAPVGYILKTALHSGLLRLPAIVQRR